MLLKELNLLQLQILMSIQKPEGKHDPRLMPKAAAVLVLKSSLHDVNEKPSNERFSCRVATNVTCCRFLLCTGLESGGNFVTEESTNRSAFPLLLA